MKNAQFRFGAGCRSCGSLSIDVRGNLAPQSIVRCGSCQAVLSTWSSYLKKVSADRSASDARSQVRHG